MIVVYLFSLFFYTLITKIIFGSVFKINMLFNVTWCVFGGLSTLGLYGLYEPDITIHLYVLVCIAVFNLIYIIISKLQYITKKQSNSLRSILKIQKPNYTLIYVINSLALLYSSLFLSKAWTIKNTYGMDVLRTYAFEGSSSFASTLELTIFQTIIQPIFIATVIICAVDVALKRQRKILVIFMIFDIAVYTFLFVGRITLVQSVFFFIIAFVLVGNTSILRLLLKNRKYIFLGIVAMWLFKYLTAERTYAERDVIESAMLYFLGPFTFLSNLNESAPWIGNLLYGKATFGFIIGPFQMMETFLFGSEYNGASYIISSITANSQIIGDGISFNALTTMLFPFMMDFGVLGILIGPAIFAVIVTLIELRFKEKQSLFLMCLYIYVIYYIPMTVMNYYFYNSQTGIFVLFLLIFTKKVKGTWYYKASKSIINGGSIN